MSKIRKNRFSFEAVEIGTKITDKLTGAVLVHTTTARPDRWAFFAGGTNDFDVVCDLMQDFADFIREHANR